MKEKKSLK